MKKRAMSSEKAREVRQKGHDDAKYFAKAIGMPDDYQNDPKAKKDVIDFNGDAHSVKSGVGYWQIFLYSQSRFETDNAFLAMNGIGQIMLECINIIPESKSDYNANKSNYKSLLSNKMIELKDKLVEKYRFKAFLEKSIFNGSEVNYLTIKNESKYHIFINIDVIETFANNIEVANSKGEYGPQKVIFKLNNKNCGEIEMRNGEIHHHREIKFRLHKKAIIELLIRKINNKQTFNNEVIVYGKAIKHFIK